MHTIIFGKCGFERKLELPIAQTLTLSHGFERK